VAAGGEEQRGRADRKASHVHSSSKILVEPICDARSVPCVADRDDKRAPSRPSDVQLWVFLLVQARLDSETKGVHMTRWMPTALCLCLASTALAQTDTTKPAANAPSGMPDMTKMGPGTRKVKNEAASKKAIQAMIKDNMAAMEKGNVDAAADKVDFPVLMVTDSPTSGEASSIEMSRDQWVAMMKPFMQPMPKDVKFSSKDNITVLTDSLAQVVSEYSMTMGGHKMSWKSSELMVRKNGKWLIKSMTEGGWGDMPVAGQQAKAEPATK
jgi:hypothetical protein